MNDMSSCHHTPRHIPNLHQSRCQKTSHKDQKENPDHTCWLMSSQVGIEAKIKDRSQHFHFPRKKRITENPPLISKFELNIELRMSEKFR